LDILDLFKNTFLVGVSKEKYQVMLDFLSSHEKIKSATLEKAYLIPRTSMSKIKGGNKK